MDVISQIVKNLLVIIIISSFLEIMLPDGNIKPFVRFAIGLFILIAVLSPTLNYLYDDRNFKISVWDGQVDDQITKDIESGSQKIQQQISGKNNELMKQKLEGQISAVAVLVPGVDDVHTEVQIGENGLPEKVQLIVRPGGNKTVEEIQQVNGLSGSTQQKDDSEQENIRKKILQVMNNLYGLNTQNIKVEFEGG